MAAKDVSSPAKPGSPPQPRAPPRVAAGRPVPAYSPAHRTTEEALSSSAAPKSSASPAADGKPHRPNITRHFPQRSPQHRAGHLTPPGGKRAAAEGGANTPKAFTAKEGKKQEAPPPPQPQKERKDSRGYRGCGPWWCLLSCCSCLRSSCTIFSFSPRYRSRNQSIMLVATALIISALYTGMGAMGVGRCPVQPPLPYWVTASGCLSAVGAPTFVLYYRRRLSPYLKHSANEDLHQSVYDGLRNETHHAGGAIKYQMISSNIFLAN